MQTSSFGSIKYEKVLKAIDIRYLTETSLFFFDFSLFNVCDHHHNSGGFCVRAKTFADILGSKNLNFFVSHERERKKTSFL